MTDEKHIHSQNIVHDILRNNHKQTKHDKIDRFTIQMLLFKIYLSIYVKN